MANIMIVAEGQSFLLISIKEKLRNLAYKVIETPADIDSIHSITDQINAILIYADETLVTQVQAVHFIKDRAIVEDIPVFIAGESKELAEIKHMIPKDLINQEFARPIHVNNLVGTLDGIMKQISLHSKKKILVVDDSGAMLRTVKGWLEDKYSVFLASSGAMAIRYITLNRPDLILLDYDMPVCDGKQVLEMIRAEEEFSNIPVMFLTNKGDTVSILKVKSLNPDAYLLKTMAPSLIVKSVDNFFEAQKGLKL